VAPNYKFDAPAPASPLTSEFSERPERCRLGSPCYQFFGQNYRNGRPEPVYLTCAGSRTSPLIGG
jgi:hypothetical protein